MVSALEEIVWAMNPQHDSLASVVSYFHSTRTAFLALPISRSDGNHLRSDGSRRGRAGAPSIVSRVQKPLTNLVNHSEATEVRLHITMEHDQLHVRIADNGRGPAATNPPPGDGIANMRSRVKQLGGHFEISSEPGRGTTVNFSAP